MKPGPLSRLGQNALYLVCRELSASATMALTSVRHFNVPDLSALGGVVIAGNHQSYLDPVLIGGPIERRVHFLARSTLFEAPGFGPLIRLVGAHPVRRGEVDRAALRTMMSLLRSGEALVVFPEGTRTPDGSLGVFRPGVASISARCGVPVLPVCIEGAFRCWPRGAALPRPARVAVAFGEPLWPQGRDGRGVTRAMVEQIEGMQKFLCDYMGRSAPETVDTCSRSGQKACCRSDGVAPAVVSEGPRSSNR